MRAIGSLHPTDQTAIAPDTVGSVIITTLGAVVAQDWPSNAQLVHFSGGIDFYANFSSTAVSIPSTNSAGTTASSGLNEYKPGLRQIPAASTGYSITGSSGVVTASFWRK